VSGSVLDHSDPAVLNLRGICVFFKAVNVKVGSPDHRSSGRIRSLFIALNPALQPYLDLNIDTVGFTFSMSI